MDGKYIESNCIQREELENEKLETSLTTKTVESNPKNNEEKETKIQKLDRLIKLYEELNALLEKKLKEKNKSLEIAGSKS